MKIRSYVLRLERDGKVKYCSQIAGPPMLMLFIDADSRQDPFYFSTREQAMEFWKMFQRARPADATDWIAHVEEVYG